MKKHYVTSFYFLNGKKMLLILLFVIGVISGSVYAIAIRGNEKIFFALNEYIITSNSEIDGGEAFKNSIMMHGKHVILMWLCGLFSVTSIIGYGIYYLIVFSYGFTMTSFILMYGVKGMMIGVLTCGIQGVMMIFLAMCIEYASITYITNKQHNYSIKSYTLCLLVAIVGVGIVGLLDGYGYILLKPIIGIFLHT